MSNPEKPVYDNSGFVPSQSAMPAIYPQLPTEVSMTASAAHATGQDSHVVSVDPPPSYDAILKDDIYIEAEHIEVGFSNVFHDPQTYKKMKDVAIVRCLRNAMKNVFEFVQGCMYYGLYALLGFFLTFVWGIVFAVTNFLVVWVIQPVTKLIFIWIRVLAAIVRAGVRAFLDPFFESFGQSRKYMRGVFNVKVDGLDRGIQVNTSL